MRAMAKRTSKAAVKSKPAPKSKPELKSKAKSKAKPEAATAKAPAGQKGIDPKAAEAKAPDAKPAKPATTISAVEMGARQREISVSEFFTKNRHLLGFDNPRKALLTCVKEAVDNALDAAEEAGILPDVLVNVEVAAANGAPPPASQATHANVPPARSTRRASRMAVGRRSTSCSTNDETTTSNDADSDGSSAASPCTSSRRPRRRDTSRRWPSPSCISVSTTSTRRSTGRSARMRSAVAGLLI